MPKAVTSVLELIHKLLNNYKYKMHYFSVVKLFWPVQSNQPVTDAIKKFNSGNKIMQIGTNDFSILYTDTPHSKLKRCDEKTDPFLL